MSNIDSAIEAVHQAQAANTTVNQLGQTNEEYLEQTNEEYLDALQCAVWGPYNTPSERQEASDNLIKEITAQIWSTVSLADFSESMEFVQYELAYSHCYMAWSNGKKAGDKLSKEREKLQQQLRNDSNETEFGDQQIDRINQRIQSLELRYHYWRCFYRAASNVLARVVGNAQPELAQYMNSKFQPPKASQSFRRPEQAVLDGQVVNNPKAA